MNIYCKKVEIDYIRDRFLPIMRVIFFLLFSVLSFSQQTKFVDFVQCEAKVMPDFNSKSISGAIRYQFKVKNEIDSIRIDAKNMDINGELKINGKRVNFKYNSKEIILFEGYKKGKNTLEFTYECTPKQTLYFVGSVDDFQIWTQGQGRYTSHWLPSFDDVNEKVIFNIEFETDYRWSFYTGFSNGKQIREKKKQRMPGYGFVYEPKNSVMKFKMKKPMSSYLVMLAIGKFDKKEFKSKSGTPIELWYDTRDEAKFEPTYRYSKEIFDFLEQEIQFKYPWQVYRQVPVRDFLYAGMENTTSTIFAQDFVVDSIGFNDRNYVNVNAHELAHQWFGDVVTATSGKHHWLQEGFATYYALLAEQHVFGDDYFYNELYDYALQLKKAAKTDTIPVLNEKASSLSFYKKGAWALHTMREDIGRDKFQKIVKNYLRKYQFKNVSTDDFLNEVVRVVPTFNTENFSKIWLESSDFDMNLAEIYLKKNKAVADYIAIVKKKADVSTYKEILNSNAYFSIKQYLFYRMASVPFEKKKELIEIGMKQNLYVRQAIAETIAEIPVEFRSDYETFLNDASYKTKEIALVHLCNNFPEQANDYLEKTKTIVGNNDFSFKITWLKLGFLYGELTEYERNTILTELLALTHVNFESSVRQNALEVLLELEPFNEKVIEGLFLATQHHKWQFTSFARNTIRKLLKDITYRQKVEQLVLNSDESMKNLYLKFLNEKQ